MPGIQQWLLESGSGYTSQNMYAYFHSSNINFFQLRYIRSCSIFFPQAFAILYILMLNYYYLANSDCALEEKKEYILYVKFYML